MATKTVTVTLDNSGNITVSQDPIKVPSGGTTTIVWQIDTQHSQPNTTFNNQSGIAWKVPPPSGRKQWNQTNQPTRVSDTEWQLVDAHDNSSTGGLFGYTINLLVGTNRFSLDPDIENQVP